MESLGSDPGLVERFLPKVDRSQLGPGGCWPFIGHLNNWGYGVFAIKATRPIKMGLAHRVAFELANGHPPAPGKKVRHLCNLPACCQPAHLLEGTQKENVRDCIEAGRFMAGGLSPVQTAAKRQARREAKKLAVAS